MKAEREVENSDHLLVVQPPRPDLNATVTVLPSVTHLPSWNHGRLTCEMRRQTQDISQGPGMKHGTLRWPDCGDFHKGTIYKGCGQGYGVPGRTVKPQTGSKDKGCGYQTLGPLTVEPSHRQPRPGKQQPGG